MYFETTRDRSMRNIGPPRARTEASVSCPSGFPVLCVRFFSDHVDRLRSRLTHASVPNCLASAPELTLDRARRRGPSTTLGTSCIAGARPTSCPRHFGYSGGVRDRGTACGRSRRDRGPMALLAECARRSERSTQARPPLSRSERRMSRRGSARQDDDEVSLPHQGRIVNHDAVDRGVDLGLPHRK